ncbi:MULTISPECIES: CoA pyrophosphatase [unclassified Sphingomonas]|jgi:8-oxo-dGTP pyrophosphatase MutT (NUDIX family)|uniref:CoA pyrophosphatase n=1 Tax=unclassified Sphingomonas TaxID=196159 RepID=UPI000834A6C0|nr:MULTISPECIES: CoA pyrophosphatase [unclassified Sphingomonas]
MTLAERLRRALDEMSDAAAPIPGDTFDPADPAPDDGLPAAVLVAITDRAAPGLILTERTQGLRTHAGQVAFPGGRIDASDADAVAAALREAQEEIALDPAHVTVVGVGDRYRTVTGFDVTPVIGVIPPDIALQAAPQEVHDIFEAPLAFVLDPGNQVRRAREWQGRMRHYYEIEWNGRRIWGATAAMLINLGRRLDWPH